MRFFISRNEVPSSIRPLSYEQCEMVAGGDDGSCSSDGIGCDPGVVSGGDLPTVTVSANALGDFAAEQMMGNIDVAFENPIFAAALFFGAIMSAASSTAGVQGVTNPMGDPNPFLGDNNP